MYKVTDILSSILIYDYCVKTNMSPDSWSINRFKWIFSSILSSIVCQKMFELVEIKFIMNCYNFLIRHNISNYTELIQQFCLTIDIRSTKFCTFSFVLTAINITIVGSCLFMHKPFLLRRTSFVYHLLILFTKFWGLSISALRGVTRNFL